MMPSPDLPRFPPHALQEYALLADGERGILVGPRGDFAWMCFPRWDSSALFASLVGGPGVFAVTPTARCVWGGFYEEGSLIWHGRWVTDDGATFECREALALPSRPERAVILRRVIAIEGTARVRVVLSPRGEFGRTALTRLARDTDNNWRGRVGDVGICLSGAGEASPRPDGHGGKTLVQELELRAGETHDLVLTLACGSADPATPDADAAWSGTEAAWRQRVPDLRHTAGMRDARHAYAIMSGLTSATGGMVAAATTSLPERAREGRNYDYRYVWIRDQCYAGQAVARAGAYPLLDDAVRFVGERLLEHGPDLRPVYTTTTGPVPAERQLDLPGYPGGGDVAGNSANRQFQLDIFGEALLLLAEAARLDRLDPDGWRAAAAAAAAIEARWTEPDAGIWEIAPDHWTHSRLICAAGLRAIGAQAPLGEVTAGWLALADRIVAQVSGQALHASGRWQRSPSDERPDAALLLPSIRGAIAADDPRSIATLRAVADELTEDGYVYRYQPDERPLGEAEGAFLLCGFILSLAYRSHGDRVEAVRWFERTRSACGPPGLLSEEFDVAQRQLRGNLPQTFVHALLLECAAALGA